MNGPRSLRDQLAPLASMPALSFEGTAGEFTERFCRAVEGKSPELVAAAVWRMQLQTHGAQYVRQRAAQLIRNHWHRVGADEVALHALLVAIDDIDLEGVT